MSDMTVREAKRLGIEIKLPNDFLAGIKKSFEEIQKVAKQMSDAMKIYAAHLPANLKKLADHGWYLSGASSISDIYELSKELRAGNIDKVDKCLMKFYEEESKSIINYIRRAYPERNSIITEALKAHNQKMYFASTSLFLSTADGICHGELFMTKNKKSGLRKKLEKTRPLKEHLDLITQISAIDVGIKRMKMFNSSLNRHNVMHGFDFNYGTKLNSFKALSLLAFICDFFEERSPKISN